MFCHSVYSTNIYFYFCPYCGVTFIKCSFPGVNKIFLGDSAGVNIHYKILRKKILYKDEDDIDNKDDQEDDWDDDKRQFFS